MMKALKALGLPSAKITLPPKPTAFHPPGRIEAVVNAFDAGASVLTAVAPAGYGKTSFIRSVAGRWVDRGAIVGWASLDPDETSSRLTALIVASLAIAGLSGAERLLGEISSGNSGTEDYLIGRLIAEIEASKMPVLLCIDDAQYADPKAFESVFEHLSRYMPSNFKIAVTSRTHVQGWVTIRMLEGKLVAIHAEDLRLNVRQIRAMANEHGLSSLDDLAAQKLLKLTEGWAAAVRMFLLAVEGGDSLENLLENFDGGDIVLSDYLSETVFAQLPNDLQRFILNVSPLDRFCVDLCKTLMPETDVEGMIEDIIRRRLFLVSLDRVGRWHHFHALFRDFLLAKLRRRDAKFITKTQSAASAWYETQGESGEAIVYALKAGERDRAFALAGQVAFVTVQHYGRHSAFLSWLDQLGDFEVSRHSKIAVAAAWALAFSGAIERAEVCLEKLETPGERQSDFAPPDPEISESIDMIRCVISALKEEGLRTAELSMAWLERFPEADDFKTGTVSNALAYGRIETGDYEAGIVEARRSKAAFRRAGAPYGIVWATVAESLLMSERGQIMEAARTVDDIRTETAKATGEASHSAALLSLLLADFRYDLGKVDAARVAMDEAGDVAETLQSRIIADFYYATNAKLLAIGNDWEGAHALLKDGRARARREESPRLEKSLAAEALHLCLRAGDVERSQRLYERHFGKRMTGAAHWFEVVESFASTAHCLLIEDNMAANGHASRLINLRRGRGQFRALPLALALRSQSLWNEGVHREALRHMADALHAADKFGVVQPFLDYFELIREPLSHALESRARGIVSASSPLQTLFARAGLKLDPSDVPMPKITPAEGAPELSKREAELLCLVKQGMSNKEIAATTFLSEPTVKWHLHNCFGKLGVRNRTGAVALADSLGILPEVRP